MNNKKLNYDSQSLHSWETVVFVIIFFAMNSGLLATNDQS